ncbi:MAG TPA: LytTR family DNA-binding domain-containing protein [Polyangiaceae bacterium]|nr:LytTR family DNA-binding domain-containing protein [Polyangiaceae bacterium]
MNEVSRRGSPRLRALIVEDEWPARAYLVELLVGTGEVEIVAAVATSEEAQQVLTHDELGLDVAFVDINLATSEGQDAGLTLVRRFAGAHRSPLFVLATALRQHAAEAFDLDVVDYLLKPFCEQRVQECLARVTRRMSVGPAEAILKRVVARSKQGLVFLRAEEVLAFEANERLTYVHSKSGRLAVDLSLAALEAAGEGRWLRVHRNWLVNVEHVRALQRDETGSALVVEGPGDSECATVRVPVGRDKLQIVRDALLEGSTGIRRIRT